MLTVGCLSSAISAGPRLLRGRKKAVSQATRQTEVLGLEKKEGPEQGRKEVEDRTGGELPNLLRVSGSWGRVVCCPTYSLAQKELMRECEFVHGASNSKYN